MTGAPMSKAVARTKLCYIVGEPRRKLRAARRGDVFVTVSHRPGAGVRNEVSVRIGYPFSAESNPFARIGSDTFAFFTGVRANTNAKNGHGSTMKPPRRAGQRHEARQ